MMSPLKSRFNPLVEKLFTAARNDDVSLCAEFCGRAGNMYDTARALRIAAENKSYRSFDRMLSIIGEHECPNSAMDIAYGEDWDRVKEIGKTDRRINESLRRFGENVEYSGAPESNAPEFDFSIGAMASNFVRSFKFW